MSSKAKRRIASELIDEPLKIIPLGAGNEVGRSCLIVMYKGKTIMLDCGIHPAHKGIAALPYFDHIEPEKIDIILITHFHLDHAAALPYFLSKTNFKGRVFMTHPTKSIYQLILQDYVRVSSVTNPDPLYDEIDLNNSMDRIETINFHQTVDHKGAAMFMIEIAGVKILYTGDYSREDDRHLKGAELPEIKPDLLIIESTYGIQRLDSVQIREDRFTTLVKDILLRGGRCLIPVFALGRAQELLLILEEYWNKNPSMQSYPIFYASFLAKKCISVYQTYINMMNSHVQKQFETHNPFDFKHISFLRGMEDFHDVGPSVVFASPGMLQNGFSRKLFEEWCGEKKNGVIIPGYIVDGTLAKSIMNEPEKVEAMSGAMLPLEMSIHYVTFSAHADFNATSDFIDCLQPPHIILVHGDSNEMSRLNNALTIQLKGRKTQISTPKNCQTVELEFGTEKVAKAVGKIALKKPSEGEEVEGVVVLKDYSLRIMAKDEIVNFTPLVCSSVFQSIKIPFSFSNECLVELISQVFALEQKNEDEKSKIFTIIVSHNVKISYYTDKNFAIIEWMSSPLADIIADSAVALLVNAETLPTKAVARLVQKTKKSSERKISAKTELFKKVGKILKGVFGTSLSYQKTSKRMEIRLDEREVVIVEEDLAVEGKDEELKERVEGIVKSCKIAFEKVDYPKIDELFDGGDNSASLKSSRVK